MTLEDHGRVLGGLFRLIGNIPIIQLYLTREGPAFHEKGENGMTERPDKLLSGRGGNTFVA